MRMHSISCTKLNLDLFSLLRQHELKKINLPAKDSQSGVACNDQSYNTTQCSKPLYMDSEIAMHMPSAHVFVISH